ESSADPERGHVLIGLGSGVDARAFGVGLVSLGLVRLRRLRLLGAVRLLRSWLLILGDLDGDGLIGDSVVGGRALGVFRLGDRLDDRHGTAFAFLDQDRKSVV